MFPRAGGEAERRGEIQCQHDFISRSLWYLHVAAMVKLRLGKYCCYGSKLSLVHAALYLHSNCIFSVLVLHFFWSRQCNNQPTLTVCFSFFLSLKFAGWHFGASNAAGKKRSTFSADHRRVHMCTCQKLHTILTIRQNITLTGVYNLAVMSADGGGFNS